MRRISKAKENKIEATYLFTSITKLAELKHEKASQKKNQENKNNLLGEQNSTYINDQYVFISQAKN